MASIGRISDQDLARRLDVLQALIDDGNDEALDEFDSIEAEIEGRREWNHEDSRVREAAGNY